MKSVDFCIFAGPTEFRAHSTVSSGKKVSEITMFLGKENLSLCRTCNAIRTKFLIEMITWCKFCKRAHCSHIVGRLTEFGSSLKWGNIYKIKNQTNKRSFAAEEITHD